MLVFQFMEGLRDRQAADAVRGRIDWKYALSLELTDESMVLAFVHTPASASARSQASMISRGESEVSVMTIVGSEEGPAIFIIWFVSSMGDAGASWVNTCDGHSNVVPAKLKKNANTIRLRKDVRMD